MKCPSCGSNLDGKKCPYCGYEMYDPEITKQNEYKAHSKQNEFELEYNRLARTTVDNIRNIKFTQGFRGYNVQQMDKFLDELIGKIYYHGDYNNINIQFDQNIIKHVRFTQGFIGYDIAEADLFLDKMLDIARELSLIKRKYC